MPKLNLNVVIDELEEGLQESFRSLDAQYNAIKKCAIWSAHFGKCLVIIY